MSEKMKFHTLDGKPFPGRQVAPAVVRALAYLESLPDGTLLTTAEAAKGSNTDVKTFRAHATDPQLAPFRFTLHFNHTHWGNPRTICAAKEEFGA